jgi:hypothetical protein
MSFPHSTHVRDVSGRETGAPLRRLGRGLTPRETIAVALGSRYA